METSSSGANHAVLHAQNVMWDLVPIETCNFGAKVAFLNAKSIGEVWDPERLVILVLKSLFCIQKPQMSAGNSRD